MKRQRAAADLIVEEVGDGGRAQDHGCAAGAAGEEAQGYE